MNCYKLCTFSIIINMQSLLLNCASLIYFLALTCLVIMFYKKHHDYLCERHIIHITYHYEIILSTHLIKKFLLLQLFEENRWYNFDDSHVSPINEEEVKSAAAYVLFYRRVRTDNPSPSNGAQSCANQSHSLWHR